jgi:hypothetical protein
MRHLHLVKSLSLLHEEQKHAPEIFLEKFGLYLARGSLTEIFGESSSGKTSFLLSLFSSLTKAGEVCALVDTNNSFDPSAAVLSGVALQNLLWIRCAGNIEKAFRAADLLLQAKGFGAIWLNLNFASQRELHFIPSSYWYRFRQKVRESPTLFLVTANRSIAGSASGQAFLFSCEKTVWRGAEHFKLLNEFQLKVQSKKRFTEKPAQTKIIGSYEDV